MSVATYRLSRTQEDIYVECLTAQYAEWRNLAIVYRLTTPVDSVRLEQAVGNLVESHLLLRATLVSGASLYDIKSLRWHSAEGAPLKEFQIERVPSLDPDTTEALVDRIVYEPFNLFATRLFRVRLVVAESGAALLVIAIHHLKADGTSRSQTIPLALDRAYAGQPNSHLRHLMQGPNSASNCGLPSTGSRAEVPSASATAYWRNHLSVVQPLRMPRPAIAPSPAGLRIDVPPALASRLSRLCTREKLSRSQLLRTAYCFMLHSYFNIDSPFLLFDLRSTRSAEDKLSIGCFVESLPLVVDPTQFANEGATILDLSRRLNEQVQTSKPHGAPRISEVLPKTAPLDVRFSFNYIPNADCPPIFEGRAVSQKLYIRRLPDEIELLVTGGAHEDLSLLLTGDRRLILLEPFLKSYIGLLKQIADGCVATRSLLLADVPPFCDNGSRELPSIARLLDVGMRRSPSKLAIKDAMSTVTYGELHGEVQSACELLTSSGVRRADFVGIALPPSVTLVVVILAVIEIGAVYIPFDVDTPPHRVTQQLCDASAHFLVGPKDAEESGFDAQTSGLIPIAVKPLPYSNANSRCHIRPSDALLYCIFTSGSTGAPKGALVTVRGFANLIQWYIELCGLSESDTVLIVSSIGFDLTQKDVIGAIAAGATLAIAPKDPVSAIQFALRSGATWLNCAPTMFGLFTRGEQDAVADFVKHLRCVVLGGEPINMAAIRPLLVDGHCRVLNTYGPTECTDTVTSYTIQEDFDDSNPVPIGEPIPGVTMFTVDADGRPLPAGAVGEIAIGGVCVGDGYVATDTTELRFRIAESAGRSYRYYLTGDIGRCRWDGEWEFYGRRDNQLKLNGIRVELGEVDFWISRAPGVFGGACKPCEVAGSQRLVGFVAVGAESHASVEDNVRSFLAQHLPSYLVPVRIYCVSALPLTVSGKIDRNQLTIPNEPAHPSRPMQSKRDKTQSQLLDIWREVLGEINIDCATDLYELGLDSLHAISAGVRIREVFGIAVTMRQIFDNPSVAQLSRLIGSKLKVLR